MLPMLIALHTHTHHLSSCSSLSLDELKMIRDAIPGACIAVIEGRGHEIYLDNAEGCITALLSFLYSLG